MRRADGFTVFDTAIGWCGIAWGSNGLAAVHLGTSTESAAMRNRLRRRLPGVRETAPPQAVERVIDDIVALLRGERVDLSSVPLDMDEVPSFDRRVYDVVREIPPGSTLSYGEVAKRLGEPGSAREVGEALARNPYAIVVPCHRVVAADGKIGGFSATGGVATKLRLLSIEGAHNTLFV